MSARGCLHLRQKFPLEMPRFTAGTVHPKYRRRASLVPDSLLNTFFTSSPPRRTYARLIREHRGTSMSFTTAPSCVASRATRFARLAHVNRALMIYRSILSITCFTAYRPDSFCRILPPKRRTPPGPFALAIPIVCQRLEPCSSQQPFVKYSIRTFGRAQHRASPSSLVLWTP